MLQGFNNQWNEAAQKMRDILQNEKQSLVKCLVVSACVEGDKT